ncbi:sulfite exporter TauE/SafE family protein [Candidatus Woesearchaeota archaeon]|nr:sulfite exporter TauE/SafE family protein [Candidatus Woesearchaeota archaeon]
MAIIRQGFIAKGTTCESCAKIIERQALKVKGVEDVSFDYPSETGVVTFDSKKTDIDTILYRIEKKGYTCLILDDSKAGPDAGGANNNWLGWTFAVIGILIAGYFLLNLVDSISLPTISQNMGYGLLFIVGLLTGFHCIAMCGGFVVGYTAKDAQEGRSSHKSHLLYGVGKTLSYTIIGAAFGLLGSIIAFTPGMRGTIGLLAGLFLVLFGLKMLNVFPALRKIQFKTPAFVSRFVGKSSKQTKSPLVIGLLNGLMIACGPLQAIYVMAAGTGSMIEGAKILFVFGLGTLPVMLGFGYFASYISSRATQKILKASGVVVIILGLVMMNNGLVLTGSGYDAQSIVQLVTATRSSGGISGAASASAGSEDTVVMKDGYQEIRMDVLRSGWSPDTFVLKKGVPVKWIVNGKEITGCNNAIQVPKYGLNFKITPGEQTIEFTPDESGVVRWSCWMGMIPGTFIVKDDIDLSDTEAVQKEIASIPASKPAGTCGAGAGGGCGCGG